MCVLGGGGGVGVGWGWGGEVNTETDATGKGIGLVVFSKMKVRTSYLKKYFLPHIAKVCEKFVNFEWIFLYEP